MSNPVKATVGKALQSLITISANGEARKVRFKKVPGKGFAVERKAFAVQWTNPVSIHNNRPQSLPRRKLLIRRCGRITGVLGLIHCFSIVRKRRVLGLFFFYSIVSQQPVCVRIFFILLHINLSGGSLWLISLVPIKG